MLKQLDQIPVDVWSGPGESAEDFLFRLFNTNLESERISKK